MFASALLSLTAAAALSGEGPCDILNAAGNECVAAHSTVRALYAKYDGPLYNVTRASDGKSQLISTLSAGGFANKPSHDKFCSALDCVISNVMDQSGNGNHLGQRHKLVNASKHPIIVGDNVPVYGMWFDPGYGMHVDKTTKIATGDEPESIYAVMSGKNYNGRCCFDYGNSETNDRDDGCGTMEAIYFGNAHWRGNTGAGKEGPWVGADLEQGMYYGGGEHTKVNNQSQPLTSDFVTAVLIGRSNGKGFTLKGGDATKGTLTTMYDGPRPDPKIAGTCGKSGVYDPPRKQGAIILATGGDNSNGAQGNFYEGYMASGEASDATDAAIQENIIAVGYKFVAPSPSPSVCHVSEYCCPDAKHCLTPTSVSCAKDANACGKGQVCCPLTKICVEVGAPCENPCSADEYCCPDALHCLTPTQPGLFCKEASDCHGDEVCCPLTKLCVKVGDKCTPP